MTRYGIFLNQKFRKKVIEFLLMLATLNVKKKSSKVDFLSEMDGWEVVVCLGIYRWLNAWIM